MSTFVFLALFENADPERSMPEYTKLEYIKVWHIDFPCYFSYLNVLILQEIGFTHMRVLEGVGTLIQLGGLMARLCKMVCARYFGFREYSCCLLEYETRTLCSIEYRLY
jgi:Replication factor C C-terminal domain